MFRFSLWQQTQYTSMEFWVIIFFLSLLYNKTTSFILSEVRLISGSSTGIIILSSRTQRWKEMCWRVAAIAAISTRYSISQVNSLLSIELYLRKWDEIKLTDTVFWCQHLNLWLYMHKYFKKINFKKWATNS